MEVVIKNGIIVNSLDIFKADVGIQNGKIVALGEDLSGDENIEASGKYIFPGIIDVHTHMELPLGNTRSLDNFFTGTRSAACGGVTTIIDFAFQGKEESLKETINNRKNIADPQVVIDYSLHVVITQMNEETLNEIPDIINNYGIPSFKLFMSSRNNKDWQVNDGFMLDVLKTVSKHGGMVGVHCENGSIISNLTEKLLNSGKTSSEFFPLSRPDFSEVEAVSRAIILSEVPEANLYIFHITCQRALEEVVKSKDKAQMVYTETCLPYLIYTDEKYKGLDAQNYIIIPPLRKEKDVQALWKGIQTGDIQVVSSDHCPFSKAQKKIGDSFFNTPAGIAAVESLLPLMYTEGVVGKKINLNQLVTVLAANPAKLFGLKNKGAISIGKDADIVIFNPMEKKIITSKSLHSECDYTIFEGKELNGYPEITICRGKTIYEKGKFVGEKGDGNFIERST